MNDDRHHAGRTTPLRLLSSAQDVVADATVLAPARPAGAGLMPRATRGEVTRRVTRGLTSGYGTVE